MTRQCDQAKELHMLTSLAFQHIQSEMQQLLAREAALRDNLAALISEKSRQAAIQPRADNAAFVAGADFRWQHWVDQRRAMINAELAQVLALIENCRRRMQVSFGRDHAAAAMQTLAEKDREIRRKRRSGQAS